MRKYIQAMIALVIMATSVAFAAKIEFGEAEAPAVAGGETVYNVPCGPQGTVVSHYSLRSCTATCFLLPGQKKVDIDTCVVRYQFYGTGSGMSTGQQVKLGDGPSQPTAADRMAAEQARLAKERARTAAMRTGNKP